MRKGVQKMRKIKSFMAMLMALVIAVTSINIPAVTAFAQYDDVSTRGRGGDSE